MRIMKKIILSVSTPNNRGIHCVGKNIYKLLNKKYQTTLVTPYKEENDNKKLSLLKQIIWELKPLNINKSRFNFLINIYPRFSIDILLKLDFKKYKKGIVIHDYMQFISLKEITNLKIIFKNFNFFELLKKIYHSLIFYLSANVSDFYIFVSNHTFNEFYSLNKNSYNFQKPSLILHPLPSFDPLKVHKVYSSYDAKQSKLNKNINILFITGNPPNKRSHILIPLLEKLADYRVDIKFDISIIGYTNNIENNLKDNLKIYCPSKLVSEEVLIKQYLKADIFISTSISEGFGIPLLDALLFGINCLATDIPSYIEIKNFYDFKNLTLIPSMSDLEEYIKQINILINKNLVTDKYTKYDIYSKNYKRIYKNSQKNILKFLEKLC